MLRRLWEKLKLLWKLAKSERASPREIGWAVGIGAFVGCSPAVGMRPWLALGIATLVKKNRLFAWFGSHTSNWLMAPFIVLAEVQLSHRLRTGSFVVLDRNNVVDQAPHLLLDWCLGSVPVGIVIGVMLGFFAYGVAHRRDTRAALAKAEADAKPLTQPELRPPSSGSPA